jgi:phage terminase large subunit
MRKETNKLRDSVWKEMIEVINDFGLSQFFSINKTEFRITCNLNGTEFKCLGLDEPEKIKGFTNISDVFMDEITAFSVDDIELIDGTLRSKIYELPLQMYFAFNPISKANFVYKYFGFEDGITPPQTFILHTTYLDNPYLDSSFTQRMEALKDRNYNRWKIEA